MQFSSKFQHNSSQTWKQQLSASYEKQNKTKQNKTKPQDSQNILNNKRASGEITIPDFKLYYKAIVIKTASYCCRDRHVNQWNRTEDAEINQHTYGQMIIDK
jgi:sortase (surface protein transpeptidase)